MIVYLIFAAHASGGPAVNELDCSNALGACLNDDAARCIAEQQDLQITRGITDSVRGLSSTRN